MNTSPATHDMGCGTGTELQDYTGLASTSPSALDSNYTGGGAGGNGTNSRMLTPLNNPSHKSRNLYDYTSLTR